MKLPLRLMLLIVAMMLLGFSARAGNITEEQAKAKAQSFLQTLHSLPSVKRLAPARTPTELYSTPTGETALYVFNVGEQDGFVIVAGDDRARSILGYADSGIFDTDHIPAALCEMLAIYAHQIDMLEQTEVKSDFTARTRRRTNGTMADVTPLLATTWDQGDPYNAYCPTMDSQTALTGCVATAMAQIANYYKYPTTQVPNLTAYTSATNKINVSAWGATTFDWDNMLDSYSGSYTNAQKTAVATLMRYCGQAAQMDYGFTSVAYNGDALYGFKQKLGYNANADFKSAASYSTDGWEDLIYKEVREGRPVYYSALNGDEGCDVSGHAFVIDGYRADGNYFHVNWGWGGACNGYFNLFALDSGAPESAVTTTGWHYQMLAIIGLSPETVNTAKLTQDATGSYLITSADDWNELSTNLEAYNNGSFKLTNDISVTTMVGSESQPFSGTFDGQGHVLNINIESNEEYTAPFHWAVNCTFKNLTVVGTITVTEHFAGGLIGWAEDLTLQGCESRVTINSLYEGDGTHGGFISIVRGGTARFYDCVFSGTIKGENTYCCGGFCGWRDGGVEVFNCLNTGHFELAFRDGSATFSRNGVEQKNSFYISSMAETVEDNQGTSITTDQLADGSITRALQNGIRNWTIGLVWGQQLGTDAVPMLTTDINKGVYKVSFVVDGQVVKTVFTNGTIGDKMPEGEDFGLKNATFTCNGSTFTSTMPITSDLIVTVTGSAIYTLTLGTPSGGSISINNNSCMPGTLKKITTTPANGYVVKTITVTDDKGKILPVTQVSNTTNEFVFAFPKSSVTVNAEFISGEVEPIRFLNGGMMLPASWRNGEQPWTADTWTIWGDVCDGDVVFVGTPPTDALGHQWYEEGYSLTNSDADVLPNGNKIVWENHTASFGRDRNYDYFRACGLEEERMGDFYIRRIFTFNTESTPSKLYLSCNYDGTPAEFYINGTLVYQDHRLHEWRPDEFQVELTPEQIALIHTDGTPNVLAAHAAQDWGDYFLDCGIYDPTVLSYEVTSTNTVRVLSNHFFTGDIVIPKTVTHNGITYTVTELPDDVTNNCPYLTSMSLPPTITSLGTNVFWDLPSLQYVKSYISVYQVSDKKVLVAAPIESTAFEVDADCSNIWNNAFKFTDKLKTLTLPRSLTYIGYNAFVGCKALTEIYAYARPVPYTEWNAFEGIDKSKITVHVYASALNSYKESWGEEFNYVTIPDPQPISLTINVTNASSLGTLIEEAAVSNGSTIYDVVGITVTGTINQDDLLTLSQMCTGAYSLATIDLSGATIEGNYIGTYLFHNREKLTSIILPETLEYISDSAFRNCDGLTSIDIPASVKRICSWAFDVCDNLATVTGMEGLSECDCYGDWDPFFGTAITQPIYGGSVFLYMPPTVTGEYEIPAGIKMTAPGSIRNSQISAITLPASLINLGDDTFANCRNMVDIYCYATTPPICHSGVWDDFDRDACTIHVPASAVEDYQNADEWRDFERIVGIVALGDLVDITIKVSTAGTLDDALFNAAVAEAQISDKVLIRNLTVTGKLNADDIAYLNTLPNTLYNMNMLDLSGATLPDNAVTERMFYATLYKAIKLPATVNSIAAEAFMDSRRLQEITLPAAIETIESNTFSGCSALSTVTFDEKCSLKRIEEYAFNGLSSLKSITLPTSLEYIGSHAFAGTGLTSITIPDGVTEMGDRVVQSCNSLKNITIGNGITYVSECWAEFCDALEEVTIGKKVTSIGWRAFRGSNINNVHCYAKMPPSGNSDVFYDDINTEAVLHTYSNSVRRYQNAENCGWKNFPTIMGDLGTYPTYDLTVNVMEMGTFSEALLAAMTAAGCEDMMDISKLTVNGSVNHDDLYYLRDNVGATLDVLDLGAVTVENNDLGHEALAWCGFEELLLPNSIEILQGWHVLEGCYNLKTIDIPSSVRYIGPRTLYGAISLETVTGGYGVTDMDGGNGMYFDNCPNLKSPVILNHFFFRLPLSTKGAYEVPEHVTTIARDGMSHAPDITTLTLTENLTTILGYAFADDENLKDIYFYAIELPHTDWEAFVGFDRPSCTLHVYEEMVELFQADELWSEFNIVGDLGAIPNTSPMNQADFTDLCSIYNTLDGAGWKTQWLVNKNVQTASRWRGVTFDEDGYVTSIDLSGNGLSGDISSMTFSGLTKLTSLNFSNNAITGDIQPLAASLPKGCTLNVERQDFGYLGEHTLYELCQYGGLPTIAYYQSQSGMLASTLIGVNGVCQFYHEGTDGGQYWDSYIWADGSTVNNFKFNWPSPATVECFYPHHFTFTYKYDMGDANMDDDLNVLDLQTTLNYSNGQEWGLFNFYAADTYGPDDDINVQDIVSTVNILLAQEDGHKANVKALGEVNPIEDEACLSVENGKIVLYTIKPVAALDIRFTNIEPNKLHWNTEALGFTTAMAAQANGTHAIIYSIQPRLIEEGRTVLATFDASLSPQLTSAVLSDSKARPICVGNTVPTRISQPRVNFVNQWSLTDLSGLCLATGTHATEADILKFAKSRQLYGVFILNTDGAKRKIIIK